MRIIKRVLNSCLSGAVTLLIVALSQPAAHGEVYPHTDPSNDGNWVLREDLSDEFEGNELDETKWLVQGRDGEFRSNFVGRGYPATKYDTGWQFSPNNVRVEKGMLKITTKYEPNYPWIDPGTDVYEFTTGGVSTKATFFKGYMEIKSKSANASTTSSFWTTGSRAEIDVFESVGNPSLKTERVNKMWSSLHDWELPTPNFVWTETSDLPFHFADDFHVFAAEWDETSIKFYADGQLIHSASRAWVEANGIHSTRWPLTGGQHVWVDSEIFPWWGIPDPAKLPVDFEIEYVRVWQRDDKKAP